MSEVDKKMKELKEALEVIKKVEDQVSWAYDFTSFTCIREALEPMYNTVDEARADIENEIDILEYQIEEYNSKLADFEFENRIMV